MVCTHHRPLLSLAGPQKGRKVAQGHGEKAPDSTPLWAEFSHPLPLRKKTAPPPPFSFLPLHTALLSENRDKPKKKPRGMKGRLSFKVLPFCPIVSLLVSSL